MIEIRWHSRAGQGAKTAAYLLAESAVKDGRHVQAFPEYGPERRGAPMRAFNRISEEPITVHSLVQSPDVVVVLDPTLFKMMDPLEGLREGGSLIVNTESTPEEVKKKVAQNKNVNIYTVDATKISLETIGRPIPNTPMLGAISKALGVVKLEVLLEHIKEYLGHKISPKVVEGNLEAVKRAYEEVKG